MRLLSPSRTGGKQKKALRLFKQLEFLVVGRALRLPVQIGQANNKKASDALALQFQVRALLRSLGAGKLAREVRVEWNPRLKTIAGRADYREKLISLNPLLRNVDNGLAQTESGVGKLDRWSRSSLTSDSSHKLDCLKQSSFASTGWNSRHAATVCDEVDRTLRHELAHLLAQFRVGCRRIAPHG